MPASISTAGRQSRLPKPTGFHPVFVTSPKMASADNKEGGEEIPRWKRDMLDKKRREEDAVRQQEEDRQ